MYLPIPPQPTSARAWLTAASAIQTLGGEAHNVVIDIADPLAETEIDVAIIRQVDGFLRNHGVHSLSSVANTIFPQAILERHGPEAFYSVYRELVLPRMKKITRDWGRYFDRLTEWKKVKNNKITTINPLGDLVGFLRGQISSDRTFRNVYEMTVYDPTRDAGKVSNRQCLSFLSFKLDHDNRLMLTVMYRNHVYIARGLGNFIGLGRLQRFVANQSGAQMGSLTCVSTHAEIDHGRDWTGSEAKALLDTCRRLADGNEPT
ncbi:MAG: hypothetical protein D4S02_18200 [Rhodocyclaceae bacterium]|nr:MAG: hypothetical protein D4S02_18200 [Rhodocyclaceae bacterium]